MKDKLVKCTSGFRVKDMKEILDKMQDNDKIYIAEQMGWANEVHLCKMEVFNNKLILG